MDKGLSQEGVLKNNASWDMSLMLHKRRKRV